MLRKLGLVTSLFVACGGSESRVVTVAENQYLIPTRLNQEAIQSARLEASQHCRALGQGTSFSPVEPAGGTRANLRFTCSGQATLDPTRSSYDMNGLHYTRQGREWSTIVLVADAPAVQTRLDSFCAGFGPGQHAVRVDVRTHTSGNRWVQFACE